MSLTFKSAALLFTVGFLSQSSFATLVKGEAVPGEYVVRLRGPMNAATKSTLSHRLGGVFIKSVLPNQNIVVVKRAIFETNESAINSLLASNEVEIAEPNYIYHMSKTPNDPLFGKLWGLKNSGAADSAGHLGTVGMDIDAEKAWDIETGSDQMVIAVIDTGIDFNHPDLKDNLWTNQAEAKGVTGVDDDGNGVIDDIHGYNAINGTGDALDDQGHGSHCSGTIAGRGDDGKGIVGVNWKAQLMAVKFLDSQGSGSLEDALKGIEYATKMGAKVMSNSWGGGSFSQTMSDAIQAANVKGSVFVAAAGNDSNDNDSDPAFPASYDLPNVISVAAVDNSGVKASFSNYGKKSVHVAAPGVKIYSSTHGDYDFLSGTSMATPHVSGVVALLRSHEANLNPSEIKERIITTARRIPELRGTNRSGGMINAYNVLANVVAPPDLNDPVNWKTQNANYASANPYLKDTDETTEISVAGVKEFALYFEKFDTEKDYDTLKIYDSSGALVQTISGLNDDSFSLTVKGTYAKLAFKSDGSVEKMGWKITKIAYR